MGRPKIPPKDLRVAGPADPWMPTMLLERPAIAGLACFVASPVLAGMDEFVRPITLPMSLVAFALTRLSGLAAAVFSVLGGEGVFLLKKLPSREVLLVLIWLFKVGAADAALAAAAVVFRRAELVAACGLLTVMGIPASASVGFPIAESACGGLVLVESPPEGLRPAEATPDLRLKMPLDACIELCRRVNPVDWRVCTAPAGWLILRVVVIMELLGLVGVERLGVICAGEDVVGAAALLGDRLGLGELARLGADRLV